MPEDAVAGHLNADTAFPDDAELVGGSAEFADREPNGADSRNTGESGGDEPGGS